VAFAAVTENFGFLDNEIECFIVKFWWCVFEFKMLIFGR